MITKNSVMKIQNLVVNHEWRSVKLNPAVSQISFQKHLGILLDRRSTFVSYIKEIKKTNKTRKF